jgi:hypothetical protein
MEKGPRAASKPRINRRVVLFVVLFVVVLRMGAAKIQGLWWRKRGVRGECYVDRYKEEIETKCIIS